MLKLSISKTFLKQAPSIPLFKTNDFLESLIDRYLTFISLHSIIRFSAERNAADRFNEWVFSVDLFIFTFIYVCFIYRSLADKYAAGNFD